MNRKQAIELIAGILWLQGLGSRAANNAAATIIVQRLVDSGALRLVP